MIDARLAAWAPRTRWAEGTAGALTDVGRLLARVPPDRVARQVTRVAEQLHVPPAEVTAAALTGFDATAAQPGRGRPARFCAGSQRCERVRASDRQRS